MEYATADDYSCLYDLPRVDFCARGLHYIPRVQYGRENPRQYMSLLYRDSAAQKPIVIWIHGGSWCDEYFNFEYRPEKTLAELAEQGYLVACVEYRLAQHALFPAAILDCQSAVKYLKKNASRWNADPAKIALWGESAGAHLACMAGLNFNADPDAEVQAVVSWYAPSNLKAESEEQRAGTLTGDKDMVSGFLGCDAAKNPEKVKLASPLSYTNKKAPSFLFMHGTVDDLVSFHQSEDMCRALQDAGNHAVLVPVPEQGHGFFQGEEWYQRVQAFLKDTLQKG